MTIERRIAKLMKMDDETWLRHANPWSVWTRFATMPFLALAIWSRTWIGGWAWLIFAALCVWLWLNPRIFGIPKTYDTWAARGVFGERIWLNRDQVPVPQHHRKLPNFLSAVQSIGLIIMIYGLWRYNLGFTIAGLIAIYAKAWFVDRMVWLYEDMKNHYPQYRQLIDKK